MPVEGQVTATDSLALEGRGERPLTAVSRSATRPEEALLDELAERLAASPRGLIVAGRQLDLGLAEPVAALASAAGYPILAEPTSQLRRGHHDPSLIVSAYDTIARVRPAELAPELIVRVGELPTSKPLRQWLAELPNLRQVVLDPAADWKDPSRRAETLVRADPGLAADGLAARLKAGAAAPERSGSGWATGWIAADGAARDAVERELAELDELSEPGAWRSLARALADGDVVFAASSMPVRDLEAFVGPGRERVRFLSNRGASGIDGLVSTASGAASANGATTWAVLGDLALVHDIGGLAAARGQENLRLLVLDNGGGGIFHFLPQAEALDSQEFEAILGTPSGLDLTEAAALFDLPCARPSDPGELEAALAGDARVIVVRTDRAANLALHRRLSEAAVSALPAR